jgi:hypothetical protein
MTKNQFAKLFPLSAEEASLLKGAAHAVWNYIGGDCIEANGGRDLPRAHVIELVHDADRLSEEVRTQRRRAGSPAMPVLDALFPPKWTPEASAGIDYFLKTEVFLYKRYGL